jgi:aryl-alcohol dehydrogenase-like predicted oxidoreductase
VALVWLLGRAPWIVPIQGERYPEQLERLTGL